VARPMRRPQRLAVLVDAWWILRTVPRRLVEPTDDSPPPRCWPTCLTPPCRPPTSDGSVCRPRPPFRTGRAVPSDSGLGRRGRWRPTAMARILSTSSMQIRRVLVEAPLLGVAARATLSTLGWAVLCRHCMVLHCMVRHCRVRQLLVPDACMIRQLHDPATGWSGRCSSIGPIRLSIRCTPEAPFAGSPTTPTAGAPGLDRPRGCCGAYVRRDDLPCRPNSSLPARRPRIWPALLDVRAGRPDRAVGAATWRFSSRPDSVRAALDACHTG